MDILEQIVIHTKREIELKKQLIPVIQFEKSVLFEKQTISLEKKLLQSEFGIIAEHKRRSPSKNVINNALSVEEVVKGYEKAGATGISVLTNNRFFGGSLDDLIQARASVNTPILRKDFIIDTYQVIEAKANGADVILLIAAILKSSEIKELASIARSIDLEVLLEIHNLNELQRSLFSDINFVGVNNRNLKTFEVKLDYSKELANYIPKEFIKVSESGISNVEDIMDLHAYGYKGFLIGERFMKTENPGESCYSFIKAINEKSIR